MQRWIVFSNCQTQGLVNSLALQNQGVEVEGCDSSVYRTAISDLKSQLDDFDAIFVTDEIQSLQLADFSRHRNLVQMPIVEFGGFHPDLCFGLINDEMLRSPLVDYHSMICFAGYKLGLSPEAVFTAFNRKFFQSAGYNEVWKLEAARLLHRFSANGLDLSADLRRWARQGCFMYSFNHPKIDVLYDVATQVAIKAGATPRRNPLRPVDGLGAGPVFPVYPEIGDLVGADGSYDFKLSGLNRTLDLKSFIAASFESYRQVDVASVKLVELFEKRYERVAALLTLEVS